MPTFEDVLHELAWARNKAQDNANAERDKRNKNRETRERIASEYEEQRDRFQMAIDLIAEQVPEAAEKARSDQFNYYNRNA